MKSCPNCGATEFRIGRTHTVWEVLTVTVQDDGTYNEEDAGDFGDTVDVGEWEEATCNGCGASLDPAMLLDAEEDNHAEV